MARPTLDDLTPDLNRISVDLLGDTIGYAADGSTFEDVQAYVDYRDMLQPFEGAEIATQDIAVTGMLKADVPVKPTGAARITLPRISGKEFKPINVRPDQSGTGWNFEVKEVPSA